MPVDHTHTIIEVKDVSFTYNGETPVLSDIKLQIHQGDYLGIVGPNGGGKTTLLKLMVGLLQPTRGTILLFGQPIHEFKDWSKIGYVPQKATQFDTNFPITAQEVVEMGRYAQRGLLQRLQDVDHQEVERALKEVEMWKFRNDLLGTLSGGQQQRVFIARALASNPEVIFLDEPTVGVDQHIQQQFYTLLKKLNQKLDKTLILVTHDLNVVTRETTEIACVNKNLIYDNTPQNFLKSNILAKMYGNPVNIILHTH